MEVQAICAIATPPGSSALGIIRISGKNLKELTKKIFSKELENRKAMLEKNVMNLPMNTKASSNSFLLIKCYSVLFEMRKLVRFQAV